MSQESWEELERKGWRKRISDKNGRVSYLRPREGGRVMVVNQRRDLRDGEESLGDILWPPANKRPMQEEEPEGEEDPVIEEAREVEEAAEVMERAEVREEVLEDSEDGAEDGEDKVEHKVELLNMAGRLKDVSRRDIDIISTGEMMFELDKAMQEHDNPLRQELPLDSKKNFFVEVLKFGLSRAEHLVYTILKLTTTREREFDESTVIATAKIFVIIATAVNPQVNNTYRKKIGVFLQGCGLSSKGIAALHAMGECESERELRRTKTDLAVKDEQNVVAMAKDSTVAIAFDNMDKRAKKTLQHYTLSVLLFLNSQSVAVGATNDGLKLNDVVEKVDYAYLDLGSNKNVQEKEAFMKVTYTVLAKICATIPNFKWAADMFPEAHQHAFKETAQLKTSCHTDPTINLACMKTSDVIQVLKQLIQRFLTLLAERMDEDEKAAYSQALFLVTSEDVEEEEVRAAEQVVKVKLEQYGKLILFGDQKTVEDTQTAIEAMSLVHCPGMWLALGPRSGVLQWVGGSVPLFGWHKRRPARPVGHPMLEATRQAEDADKKLSAGKWSRSPPHRQRYLERPAGGRDTNYTPARCLLPHLPLLPLPPLLSHLSLHLHPHQGQGLGAGVRAAAGAVRGAAAGPAVGPTAPPLRLPLPPPRHQRLRGRPDRVRGRAGLAGEGPRRHHRGAGPAGQDDRPAGGGAGESAGDARPPGPQEDGQEGGPGRLQLPDQPQLRPGALQVPLHRQADGEAPGVP